jgi:hypothetical protein
MLFVVALDVASSRPRSRGAASWVCDMLLAFYLDLLFSFFFMPELVAP